MSTARSTYWDTVKAVLIFLVVLGHTGTALSKGLLSVIYAFHMPLFIFVSGYFSKKKTLKEYWGGCKRLIIIYLIFDILYIVLDYVLGETINFTRIITPSFAMWYILSLIFWRTILQFTPDNLLQRKWVILGGSLLLALAAGFVPLGTQMSFQRTFVFLPFFMLGYYAKGSGVVEWIRGRNKIVMTALFLLLSVVCYFWLPVFYAYSPYSVNIVEGMGMRLLQMLVAVVLCASMLNIIPEKMGKITEVGKWTLLIYLLHPPIVKLAKMGCSYIGTPMSPNIPMAFLISVVTIVLIYMVRKFKLFKYIS